MIGPIPELTSVPHFTRLLYKVHFGGRAWRHRPCSGRRRDPYVTELQWLLCREGSPWSSFTCAPRSCSTSGFFLVLSHLTSVRRNDYFNRCRPSRPESERISSNLRLMATATRPAFFRENPIAFPPLERYKNEVKYSAFGSHNDNCTTNTFSHTKLSSKARENIKTYR